MGNSRIGMSNLFTPVKKKEEAKSAINFTPLVKKKEEKSADEPMFSGKGTGVRIAGILGPVKMCEKNNEKDVEIIRRIAASCLNYVEDPGLEEHNFDRRYIDVRLNNTLKEALGTPDSPVKIYPGDF